VRELRDLTRRRKQLVRSAVQEKNRVQKALEEGNVQLGQDVAIYTAAVEGSLRAYESILKVKPKARWPFLDDLLEKRSKGELPEYVRQAAAAHCKGPQ
jgi:hypothetical protein